MIQYKAQNPGKKTYTYIFVLLILAIISFMISNNISVPILKPALQFCGIILLCIAISILINNCIYSYLYTISENSFTVHKLTGNKSLCVVDIDLAKAVSVPLKKDEFLKAKDSFKTKSLKYYYYLKNLNGENAYYIPFDTTNEISVVVIEADDFFLKSISDAINFYINKREDLQLGQ